jgi:hypothetical protein
MSAVVPAAGLSAWRSSFATLAQTIQFAEVSEDLPIEQRRLPDPAWTQSHRLLFESVLHDEQWLRRYLGLGQTESRESSRLAAFLQLADLRAACAMLEYELELYERGPATAMADAYVQRIQGALFVQVHRGFFLQAVEPHLQVAARLRAYAYEAELHGDLKARFNEDFWRNPSASAVLQMRFGRGQQERLVADKLELAPTIRSLIEVMAK